MQQQLTTGSTPGPRASQARGPGRGRAAAWILALTALILLGAPLLYRGVYGDRIFPGVYAEGIDLGGLDAPAAMAALEATGLDTDTPVGLVADERSWTLPAGTSGLALDINDTVRRAWSVGREGPLPLAVFDMLSARFSGRNLSLSVRFEDGLAREALERIAEEFDREAQNARVTLDGTSVRPVDAVEGRFLNLPEALARLEAQAAAGRWPVEALELPISRVAPEVPDASQAIAAAVTLLAEPMTLRAEDQAWALPPAVLAPMLTTRAENGRVLLDLDRERFAHWMQPITEVVSRTSSLPRFRYLPEEAELQLLSPGQQGLRIDLESTALRILEAGEKGARFVRLALITEPPAIADDVSAEALGIREVVGQSTSYYAGSAPGRVHNVALAASKFDGLLIPPDGVFSFNEHLGDVSEEEGYEETLIIVDGATADGVGGGVCQVSTTLFRSAFWAGLPIVERHAHGYRVAYYEQSAPTGFDATIYSPIVDLKFRNDTGAWLLIETVTNSPARTATFTLYGTKPDREVEMGPLIKSAAVPPPAPRIEVDPSMPPGSAEVVELARDGMSVSLKRIIRENGEEREETFHSTYRPTGKVTKVGPSPGGVEGEAGQQEAGVNAPDTQN